MSQNQSPSPTLLVKAPQGGTKEIEVTHTPFTIGRKTDNDLCLEDVAVSGHHARIAQVQKVLFLEDLNSTNGTFVNEQKIDRRQLQDADSIRIGTHRLIFRGNQPTQADSPPAGELLIGDKTMVVADSRAAERPAPEQKVGLVEILSGKTSQPQYRLTKHVSLIGAQDDAVITLTGWFAPKTAAVISRRHEGYVVSPTESGKRILVNGRPVQGEHTLQNGDVVEVAGITMRFLVRDLKNPPASR
ncbi:MAG: FHA domain-containing protein [Nitrospira defluvii]|nr:FHA domain-containing protein [Nitrospira defluvii]